MSEKEKKATAENMAKSFDQLPSEVKDAVLMYGEGYAKGLKVGEQKNDHRDNDTSRGV
jgi:hypothetical protein